MGSPSIPNEGKQSSWSQSATINPKNTAVPVKDGQTSVSMQFKCTPHGVYTLQFEIGSINISNKPVAVIRWTAHGNNVTRKVSVINGMSISAPCDAISVKLFDEDDSSDAIPYAVSVQAAYGTRGGNYPPTLQNESIQTAAKNGGTAVFSVPQDAGALSVFITAWNAVAALDQTKILVIQTDDSSAQIRGYYDPAHLGFVPLAPSVTQIIVVNLDTANDAEVSIAFGIDG